MRVRILFLILSQSCWKLELSAGPEHRVGGERGEHKQDRIFPPSMRNGKRTTTLQAAESVCWRRRVIANRQTRFLFPRSQIAARDRATFFLLSLVSRASQSVPRTQLFHHDSCHFPRVPFGKNQSFVDETTSGQWPNTPRSIGLCKSLMRIIRSLNPLP